MSATDLLKLEDRIVNCAACPRLLRWCSKVAREKVRRYSSEEYWGRPVPGFGDPAARLLVVGLAPAAHGANRTGRMFTGDSSGDWLYEALHRFGFASQAHSSHRGDGLCLLDCWVTAAVRCAPPENRPSAAEIARCRRWLASELAALPRTTVVVTLGRIALDAWLGATGLAGSLRSSERPRFGHGETWRAPGGTTLIMSYHPSRQNTNTGRLTRPMWHSVFQHARDILGNSGSG